MTEKNLNPELKKRQIMLSEAVTEDAPKIAELRKITWLDTYVGGRNNITKEDIQAKDFDSPEKIEKIEHFINDVSGKTKTWVAKEGDKVVGYCASSKDGQYEIRAIYVLPDYQGLGAGKNLMQEAMQWLGGDKDIHLYVADYNLDTIEFYKSLGFVVTDGKVPEGYAVNGKDIPLVKMTKFNNSDKSNQ